MGILRKILFLCLLLVLLLPGAALAQHADSLLARLEKAGEDTVRVRLLIQLAQSTDWEDVNQSEKYATRALKLSQKADYLWGMAHSQYQLARTFSDFEPDLSERLALQALDGATELADSILIARIYNTLGKLKDNSEDDEGARKYYLKALGIYQRNEMDSAMAGIYNNLGILFSTAQGDTTAFRYYLKAAEINERKGNYLGLSINYLNMGYEMLLMGRLGEGIGYLRHSLALVDEHQFVRVYPWIYNNISFYHFQKKEYQESIDWALKGLSVSRDQANRLQERDALQMLNDSYNARGDTGMAYRYLEELHAVTDTINRHNRLKELDLLEMQYKYRTEYERHALEEALLISEHRRKEAIYLLVIVGAGLIILTFVLLYSLQHGKIKRKNLEQKNILLEKEKLTRELDFKKKEITTNVMYLLKKNEFISTISDKLKDTRLGQGDQSNALERIITELDKSISDDNWTEFEVRFQEVHVDFYNRLSRQFPDLTPNELRLCAFLRLNMTSKEISDITFQSPESLKTARYRLRKKLDLSREDNLVRFLTQF